MQETTKQQVERLANKLRVKQGTEDVDNMMALFKASLESTKHNLVTADISEFQKLQGEASAYNKLIKMIERKPLNEETSGAG